MDKLFFCLGVTKGGTTWLHWVLSHNKEMAQIPRKEIHYFLRQYGGIDRLSDYARMQHFSERISQFKLNAPNDRKGILEVSPVAGVGMPWDDQMNAYWKKNGVCFKKHRMLMKTINWYRDYLRGPIDDEWYKRLFATVPEGKWPMDFSVTGFMCQEAGIHAMSKIADDSRAIIILRDPIDRLWSHVKFHAQVTGEIDLLPSWSNARILEFVEHFNLFTNSFYGQGIESLYRNFPADKRLVVDFGDIKTRPEGVISDVMHLLDLPPMQVPIKKDGEKRINVSQSIPMPPGIFSKYADAFVEDLERVKACGIDFVDPWIANAKEHALATSKTHIDLGQPSVGEKQSLMGRAKRIVLGR